MASPVGELRIVANGEAITAIDFLDQESGANPRSSMARAAARTDGRPLGARNDDDPLLRQAVAELEEYFARGRKEFDVAVQPEGTEFQLKVWEQLRRIAYGELATYGEIAGRLGKTGHGARAVGLANGRNPIPIVIPCHRVVGADGSLTGYGGGVERKQFLLDLEQDALF
jgi:methylated-DNA-[protein]-cysteine S-methyltransferase